MIDLAEKTRQDFAQKKEEIAGEIAIGSGELFSVRALGKMLADFQALHPKVRYNLFSGNADHIKERIESGTLDLGLLSLPVDVAKYDFLRFPMREEWGALVRQEDVYKRQLLTTAPIISCGELHEDTLGRNSG